MTKQEIESVLNTRTKDDRASGYHMMATTAYHLLGDISNDKPDICFIYSETTEYYVGSWVFGYGFFNVLFPKSTTKELTKENKDFYDGMGIEMNGYPVGKLEVFPKVKEL